MKNLKKMIKIKKYIHLKFWRCSNFIESVKNLLINTLKKRDIEETEKQFTFDYIVKKEKLVLPLLYQSLIELTSKDNIEKYTNYLYDKYYNIEDINKLLYIVKNISDIPIESLSKYYARLYTLKSPFYSDINKELREKKREKYLTYIRVLYEGVKIKSLPLASNNILYLESLKKNI